MKMKNKLFDAITCKNAIVNLFLFIINTTFPFTIFSYVREAGKEYSLIPNGDYYIISFILFIALFSIYFGLALDRKNHSALILNFSIISSSAIFLGFGFYIFCLGVDTGWMQYPLVLLSGMLAIEIIFFNITYFSKRLFLKKMNPRANQ
jgi:hypothetical protein